MPRRSATIRMSAAWSASVREMPNDSNTRRQNSCRRSGAKRFIKVPIVLCRLLGCRLLCVVDQEVKDVGLQLRLVVGPVTVNLPIRSGQGPLVVGRPLDEGPMRLAQPMIGSPM